jgi:uncharacterized protein (DUF2235 family)
LLAKIYEDGDEVYVLGFSRGAYTARSLVGLIRNSGLVTPENLNKVTEAYQLYRTRDAHADGPNAVFFRDNYSHILKIKFVGVWDTVGALGIPIESFEWFNKAYYEFHDTELSGIVENAFHALAVDEYRENYAPTLWAPSTQPNQRMEQVWFTGSHADVGGGYPQEQLSDIALAWMQDRASSCGLAIDTNKIPQVTPANSAGKLHNSFDEFMRGFYRLTHARYFRAIGKAVFGNEQVHPAVVQRLNADTTYHPKNPVGDNVTGVRTPGSGRL